MRPAVLERGCYRGSQMEQSAEPRRDTGCEVLLVPESTAKLRLRRGAPPNNRCASQGGQGGNIKLIGQAATDQLQVSEQLGKKGEGVSRPCKRM